MPLLPPLRLSAILLLVLTCSCGNKKASTTGTGADTATTPATITTVDSMPPGFRCTELPTDSLGIPYYILSLKVNGIESPVDTINNCGTITRDEYARYEIPTAALDARGGWYAGAGDYYYLVLENGKPVLYAGWQDEMQKDEGFHWEKRIIKGITE